MIHMKRRQRRQQAGFTLIELVVVMTILAILAILVVPRVVGRVEQSRRARALSDLKNLGTCLDLYAADNGKYPTTEQGLAALQQEPNSEPRPRNWSGPYLKEELPADPWGNDYGYTSPGQFNDKSYDLVSFGPDGQPGGTGDDADISNYQQ